jgi:hypothetical protein
MAVTISYLLETADEFVRESALYDQWGNVIFPEFQQKTCWNEAKIVFSPEGEGTEQ